MIFHRVIVAFTNVDRLNVQCVCIFTEYFRSSFVASQSNVAKTSSKRAKVTSPSVFYPQQFFCSVKERTGWSEVNSFFLFFLKKAKLYLHPRRDPPASRNLGHLHGARPAHDQVGHPPSVSDWGDPAGQEEPAGAVRQLHPHPDLPAAHLHHRPAEQLRSSRQPDCQLRCGLPLHASARSSLTLGTWSSNQSPPSPFSLSPSAEDYFSINIFTSSFIWHCQKRQSGKNTLECMMLLYQKQVINVTEYIYPNRRCLTCE